MMIDIKLYCYGYDDSNGDDDGDDDGVMFCMKMRMFCVKNASK